METQIFSLYLYKIFRNSGIPDNYCKKRQILGKSTPQTKATLPPVLHAHTPVVCPQHTHANPPTSQLHRLDMDRGSISKVASDAPGGVHLPNSKPTQLHSSEATERLSPGPAHSLTGQLPDLTSSWAAPSRRLTCPCVKTVYSQLP